MHLRNNYKATIFACCIGYIAQAVVCGFAPLLFLTFEEQFGISPIEQTLLITVNFAVQLCTDILSSRFVPRLGYRRCVIIAHACCSGGLILFAVLPFVIPSAMVGLLIPVCIFAVGGGLLEVLISPIVEACPTKNKGGFISLLHSFFCWGTVFAVGLSTLFFYAFSTPLWPVLSVLWALLPLANIALFLLVTIYPMQEEKEQGKAGGGSIFRQKVFWLMLLFMVCSGASELAVEQWASAFTEKALSVSKTMGDLIGVCGFATMMGTARLIYAKFGAKIPVKGAMAGCALLCIVSYFVIGLTEAPVWGLLGCCVCGFAVGIFWPASFSMATVRVRNGGTAMFAFLAFSGDIGCSLGPSYVGVFTKILGDDLRYGIFSAVIFPILLLGALLVLHSMDRRKNKRPSSHGAIEE